LLALWFAVIACGLVMGLMILPTTFASAYNLEFFFGMAIALRLRRGVVPCARPILLTGLAAFALACAAEVFGAIDGYQPWARFAYGVPSGLIILGLVALERNGDVLVPAPLQWLGRGSYSIYLFHLTVIGVTYKLWSLAGMEKWAPLWLSLGLIAAAGVGGGVIISRTVEYPLMRWIRHRLRRIDGP
jgi:peptidoglycan/LPS O-acetylase OafA/YrhL